MDYSVSWEVRGSSLQKSSQESYNKLCKSMVFKTKEVAEKE